MHLYAVAVGTRSFDAARLGSAVRELAPLFGLDAATAWDAASRNGRVTAAGAMPTAERSAPRRYLARDERFLTFFDGLPVASDPALRAHDAGELASNWTTLDGTLEGQFNATRIDLAEERAELLLDTLGLAPVFAARCDGGVLIGNSATLVAALAGLDAPDPLGVGSLLGLGWASGGRTLVAGVEPLAGGGRHVVAGDGTIRSFVRYDAAAVARRQTPTSAAELAEQLTNLTANAFAGIERVQCPITAGRDTRVLLALAQATGVPFSSYTAGDEGDLDVVVARELAARLELEHRVELHDGALVERDWTAAARRFLLQNDGLSSLLQLPDQLELPDAPPPLGLRLWGVGGEIGRAGTGDLTALGANVPALRRSLRVQRRLLAMKVRDEAGLMTSAGTQAVTEHLDRFIAARLDEGWDPATVQETFYAFDRVAYWGATGPRRAAMLDDVFTPFSTRAFVDHCFASSSGERYVEAVHHRLLGALSPELLEHRFQKPFQRQRPRLAGAMATAQLAGVVGERVRGRVARPSPQDDGPVTPDFPFQHRWIEAHRTELQELVAARGDDPLWELISRPRLAELLAGDADERARHGELLLRAVTVVSYFAELREQTTSMAAAGVAADSADAVPRRG